MDSNFKFILLDTDFTDSTDLYFVINFGMKLMVTNTKLTAIDLNYFWSKTFLLISTFAPKLISSPTSSPVAFR